MKMVVSDIVYERGGIPNTIIISENPGAEVQYRIRKEGITYHVTKRAVAIPWSDFNLLKRRLREGDAYDAVKNIFGNPAKGKDASELCPHLTGLFAE